MTPHVTAKSSVDLLAALPRILGYTPTNSIVIQTFHKKRTAASLRVDLPPESEHTHPRIIADAMIRLISRVPGVDAILLAIYTDDEWPTPSRPPRADLVEAIVTRMGSAGLGIIDAVCFSAPAWASYLDAEHGVIDEHQSARIEAELDSIGAPREGVGAAQGAPPIEPGHAGDREALAIAATAISRSVHDREGLWNWSRSSTLWADALDSTPTDIPAEASAALLWSVRDTGVRDCVLMYLAWGGDAGDVAARDTELLQHGSTVPAGSILETFVGDGRTGPDGLRIEGAVRLLRHLISIAPRPWQLAPLTMLAWLEWARGQGSSAGDYLDQALSIGPGYELARLFDQMLSAGRIPDWVGRSPS
jgi:hypothetical protein